MASVCLTSIGWLQPLTGLQNLAITGRLVAGMSYCIVSRLTALTGLNLPLAGCHDPVGDPCRARHLTSISSCTSLRSLLLNTDDQPEAERPLLEEDCQAVAQLTRLTELRLVSMSSENGRDLATALQALIGLEALTVELSAAELIALSALTRLTELALAVHGRADAGNAVVPDIPTGMCPAVRSLAVTGMQGPFPFKAFSNIVDFTQWSTKGADCLLTIAHRFPLLERYHLGGEFTVAETDSASLYDHVPTAHRDAAIDSLSRLQHLTELTISSTCDADITRIYHLSQLRKLWLLVPMCHSVTVEGGLVQLKGATHLQHLVLELPGLVMSKKRAVLLVKAVKYLQQLELYVSNSGELADAVSHVPAGHKPLEVYVRSFT